MPQLKLNRTLGTRTGTAAPKALLEARKEMLFLGLSVWQIEVCAFLLRCKAWIDDGPDSFSTRDPVARPPSLW